MTRPPLDLEAIRQRVEAATDAEWQVCGDKIVACDSGWPAYWVRLAEVDSEADAVFIAHAREDVPALLAEVARLQGAMRHEASSLRERASFHPNKGYVDGLNFGAWTLENILGEADYGS